jgi:hypothetical protein
VEHEEGDPLDPGDDVVLVTEGVPLGRNAGDVTGKPPAHRWPAEGYAAHTKGFNSGSVGLALCGMRGAVDRRPDEGQVGDVDPGPSPITSQQLNVAIALCVQFLTIWGFHPTEDRIFTHYEAEALHGVKQSGKWDITYIPGKLFSRRACGPWIRRQIGRFMDGKQVEW